MKKRGQVLGIPFVMLFAIIIGALILIFGLKWIYDLTQVAGEISIFKDVNEFKSDIQTFYYLEEGNTKREKISFMQEVKNICFYDSDKGWNPMPLTSTTKADYPPDFSTRESFYQKFFEAFKTKNLFVFPTERFKQAAFPIPHLTLESQTNNPICIRNGREVKILSKGDHVEIEYVSPP